MKKLITDNFELHLQDAIQGLSALPDNSFDLAICDPPYGAATSAKWNYESDKKVNGFGGNWKLNNEEWDLLTGPVFNYSETWQLVINTGTTIITFLMVFLIQKAQNKDSKAIQIKLNELIASNEKASNRIVDIEDLTEKELDQLHRYYEMLSDYAEKEEDIHQSHSIDAARRNQDNKYEAFQKRHEEWLSKQNQKKEAK